MTPIECPQCHGEVTDCPHCGFPLDDAAVQPEQEKPKTALGAPIRNPHFGLAFTVAGVLGLVGGLFLLVMSSVLGLLIFIISVLSMAWGISLIIGYIEAECPFCNQRMHMAAYAQSITCRHCKTISVRKENNLELL